MFLLDERIIITLQAFTHWELHKVTIYAKAIHIKQIASMRIQVLRFNIN